MVVNKLIMLYVLEKMDIPLTESSIIEICTHKNEWISYMDCLDILWQLLEAKFVFTPNPDNKDGQYTITYDGTSCLSHHYQKIPNSLRQEIYKFTQSERMNYKRSQEYFADHVKHEDGSFMVTLQIKDKTLADNVLSISFKTRERSVALSACKKWKEFAPKAYGFLYDNLFS